MLTDRQRHVFDSLCVFIDTHEGKAPTFSELSIITGLSRTNLFEVYKSLAAKGFIRRLPRMARAVEILRRPGDVPSTKVDRDLALQTMARAIYERPYRLDPETAACSFDRARPADKSRAMIVATAAYEALAEIGALAK